MNAGEETQVGRYVLSTAEATETSSHNIELELRNEVKRVAFDLIDADGNEAWEVTLTVDGSAESSQSFKYRGHSKKISRNGRITHVEILSEDPIQSIRISCQKRSKYFGFGLDNFEVDYRNDCSLSK